MQHALPEPLLRSPCGLPSKRLRVSRKIARLHDAPFPAQDKISSWHEEYNEFRPHSSIGDIAPLGFFKGSLILKKWLVAACLWVVP